MENNGHYFWTAEAKHHDVALYKWIYPYCHIIDISYIFEAMYTAKNS